jgi:hypothetical protein
MHENFTHVHVIGNLGWSDGHSNDAKSSYFETEPSILVAMRLIKWLHCIMSLMTNLGAHPVLVWLS